MSQKRYLNHRDPVSSFDANAKYSGILPANVYTGFDNIIDIVGLTFKLDHQTTGQIFTDIAQATTAKLGIWITKQGTVIKEDAAVSFTVATNVGNSKKRIDLLVGRHYHDNLFAGGVPATYEVITGPTESFTDPVLPSPQTATILGRIIIAENSSSIASAVWKRNRGHLPGGDLAALLGFENKFTSQQQFAQGPDATITLNDYEVAGRSTLLDLSGGNYFQVNSATGFLDLIGDKPNGTEIKLQFKADTVIRNINYQLSGATRAGYLAGMRPIGIDDINGQTMSIKKNQVVTLVKTNSGVAYGAGVLFGDYWKITTISDMVQLITITNNNITNLATSITNLQTQITEITEEITEIHQDITQITEEITVINNEITEIHNDITQVGVDIGETVTYVNDQIAIVNTAMGLLNTKIESVYPPRMIVSIDYVGALSDSFDGTGKGKSAGAYYGWVICNGQNTAPDYRGRCRVGATNGGEGPFQNVGDSGGEIDHTLTVEEMPNHNHPITVSSPGSGAGDRDYVSGTKFGTSAQVKDVPIGYIGGGNSHNNLQPYICDLPVMWLGFPPAP